MYLNIKKSVGHILKKTQGLLTAMDIYYLLGPFLGHCA